MVERQFSEPEVIAITHTPQGNVATFGAKAYLRKFEIVVQQPEMDYSAFAAAYANKSHEMPLRKLRLTTLVTPKLDPYPEPDPENPHPEPDPETSNKTPRWIRAGDKDVLFHVIGEDWDGHQISFEMPLMFVPYKATTDVDRISRKFLGQELDQGVPTHPRSRNVHKLHNQTLAYAPGNGSDATYLATGTIEFGLQLPPTLKVGALPSTYPPRYLPVLHEASVNIPAVDQLLGHSESVSIGLHKSYLEHGMAGENAKAEVFVYLKQPVQLSFATEKAGGLANRT
ncbi:MAG: hypothetical protein R2932_00015 [Caldilineaceae bacterium]